MRLLELAAKPILDLDLHGSAKRALDWFTANSEGLERHVRDDPNTSMEDRRKRVIGTLRDAVRRDEKAEDENIIRRELSPDRIAAFTAGVYASAFTPNTIERIFADAEAILYLSSGHEGAPGLRGIRETSCPKGLSPSRLSMRGFYYAPLDGGDRGEGCLRTT